MSLNRKEEAPIHYDVGDPVGYHLQNASSDSSIYRKNDFVNTSDEKKSGTSLSYTPETEQDLTNLVSNGEITVEEYGRRMLEFMQRIMYIK